MLPVAPLMKRPSGMDLDAWLRHCIHSTNAVLSVGTTRVLDASTAASRAVAFKGSSRRPVQGRFDDAIARWYRLMEWTAQWQLRKELNADTADFPSDLLPEDADVTPRRDGKIKIGLWQAWQVVKDRVPGPAQKFVTNHGKELLDLLEVRNNSILAHGFRPVSESDWQRVHSWTKKNFCPF